MDALTKARYEEWKMAHLEDEDLMGEMKAMEGDEKKITDAFFKELEFGTGGLRGVIGAGTNRMNVHTVAKATQGYSDYLNANFSSPTVAIAHDSRNKGILFSESAAAVFAANGIKVWMYPELMPTPALSFAVRHLGCSGGIVVTASHNPAKYNGYKVYGPDGCQITTEGAAQVGKAIAEVDTFNGVKKLSFQEALEKGLIEYISEETVTAFIDAVSAESLLKDGAGDKDISIVYTPLNGAGCKCVTRCLKENGYTNIHIVKEQENPDGNFPTCPYPNPEIREALELGLRDLEASGSDILIATDPDSDRVGIALKKKDGGYRLFSGNETGMLLLDYIAKRRIELGLMPKDPVAVKTIVTSDMASAIAADYGIEIREVLTGFKYIGEQIGLLEKEGHAERYIFGFEESYGYLSGSYVRDKDAVDGSLMIADMAAYYKAKGLTLIDVLEGLYAKYGYRLNTLYSFEFEGAEGFTKMKSIMKEVRTNTPSSFIGEAVIVSNDYLTSLSKAEGKESHIDLPVSDVLKYITEGGTSIVIRPSGTEPKLKVYLSVKGADEADARAKEAKLKAQAEQLFGLK